jgi:hypothetical protein
MSYTQVRENFCGACLAVPLIFAGGGLAAAGGLSDAEKKEAKKKRMYTIWFGIITTILSIIAYVYFRYYAGCTECQLPG